MKTGENTTELAIGSWLVALLAGTLAGIMLWVLGDWRFIQALFVGGVVTVLLGFVISSFMTKPLSAPGSATIEPATPGETPAKVKKTPPTVEANKDKIKSSTALPGRAELASRKGSWSYKADGAEPSKKAAEKPAKKPASKAEDAPEVDMKGRPAALTDKARAGGADDLKLISGVGPKLEETLNSLGIWHFDQVASLTGDDIAWVDERLRFKGRIERDDWVGQAKILAAGGETEFSKKKS